MPKVNLSKPEEVLRDLTKAEKEQRAAIEKELTILRDNGFFAAASFLRIHFEALRAAVNEAIIQEAAVLSTYAGGADGQRQD